MVRATAGRTVVVLMRCLENGFESERTSESHKTVVREMRFLSCRTILAVRCCFDCERRAACRLLPVKWAVGVSSATTVRGVVVFFGASVDLRMSILGGAVRLSSGSPEHER